ncbi:MAG: trigger factor [Prevotella sp.]|jgi:trigger factor|nr:trigger factor [Prevotella sp.]MBR1526175.1 trigger factor [Prevotella sp.]
MKISFENPDKINGLMTLTVEEADYKENVEKKLKDYRKKANVPGFRPGMVPMGLIKRQYGTAIKVDEVNKLVGENIYKYVQENNIAMLGEPMPSDKQVEQDLESDGPFTFVFDIAVAPEFKIELTNKDKINYYNIDVDDKLIDEQVESFAARAGHYDKVEAYDPELRDMLKGDLREQEKKGKDKEDGITVSDAVLMPQYIKVDKQKKLFEGCKVGDIITFNPKKAYPDNDAEIASLLKVKKEDVKDLKSDFTFQITEISRFVKADVDQKLFDQIYGEGEVKTEEEFRNRIAEGIKAQFAGNSDYRFLLDIRKYAEDKVGELKFPEELLKRIMKNNNRDREEDFVEKNFEGSLKELKWHLIKEQLVNANEIKIEQDDIKNAAKESARAQFAQYGMTNVPDEYLDNYATDLLKKQEQVQAFVDRAIDMKLTEALKKVVKLTNKKVSLDGFNKLFEEK